MRLFYLLPMLCLFSCGNEKAVQLPEIQNAKITTVQDISPAYIFYDETKPDSVELNRKNLIISTNWLFNVDKRLTLRQAVPSIKKLQKKSVMLPYIKMKMHETTLPAMIPALKT
ncbi:hypothetical protein N7U66_18105 [Lacinutrix neustonica]|uniref:Uncharacterized protein n=1 Tax=Lacinutrix neustonica TaxID=2980107 RepID=A0A9E8MUL0_9FLAO|nr:hypothetical protein [Lacinutrix neustonica]WAC01778.1 hypothetical protein N7U66_18105 [Lacinutrix neustonica]